ncbi:MAG TPA: hypothetical protein VK438_14885 [Xanthobacteraceae bacterium]|nr:hypothetical protein [Xanthobacteraceae bacterium]
MRISPVGPSATARSAQRPAAAPQAEVSESRALVAIEPAAPHASPRALARHPASPFLAQLIATHLQVPQTRERRRAEPAEAIAAYRAMQAQLA